MSAHNLFFFSRNKKNNVYPCKPQFYYIKVGFKGVKILLACFRDVKIVLSPSEKGSILHGKNLLRQGANSFLIEYIPFQKGTCVQKSKQGVIFFPL